MVYPLLRLQFLALSNDAAGYAVATGSRDLATVLGNTLGLALGSLAIAMVLGIGLSWFATRLSPRLRWLGVVPLLPLVLPGVAIVSGWAFLFSPRAGYVNTALRTTPFFEGDTGPLDIFGAEWIMIVTGLSLTSFVYVFVNGGLRSINAEVVDAAQVSGAGPFKTFASIVLPLARPSLLYGGGIAFLLGLGQFTAPLLLGTRDNYKVITTDIYSYMAVAPTDQAAAAAMTLPLLVVGVLVIFGQRLALRNQVRFVTHTGKSFANTSASSPTACIPIVLYGLIALVLPFAALLNVALSPFYSGKIDPSSYSLQNLKLVLSDDLLLNAVKVSVITSTSAAIIVSAAAYCVASVLYNARNRRLSAILEFCVNLPLGVPAVVFGVGFLSVYAHGPIVLYGTLWVVILVYVVLMLPFAVRMLLAARLSLGDAYVSAARTSGATRLRAELDVILPLMRPAIASGLALMFILLSHEFAASLLVRSGRTQVMGTMLFDLWSTGSYPASAAMAVVMCVITSLGVALALAVSGRRVLERV